MRRTTRNNRSTQRTRAAIRAALFSIMAQKPIERITVQELIDRANICRTTFYAHYQGLYDLLESVGNEIIDQVGTALSELSTAPVRVGSEYPTIQSVLQVYAEHGEEIRALNGPNGDPSFDARLQDRIYEVTRRLREQKEGLRFNEDQHRIYSCYVIGGGIRLLNEMILQNRPWDLEKTAGILNAMAAAAEQIILDHSL